MRATIHDATGPQMTRWLVPAIALVVVLVWLFGAVGQVWGAGAVPCVAVIVALVAPWIPGRFRARATEVTPLPGRLVLRGAGRLSQSIEATDVLAASSARTARGFGLAMQCRGHGAAPIHLEFETEADLRRALEAIGITRRAFGMLSWTTHPLFVDKLGPLALVASVGLWTALAMRVLLDVAARTEAQLGTSISLLLGGALLGSLAFAAIAQRFVAQLAMTTHGLIVQVEGGYAVTIPYATIASVAEERGWLVVRTLDGRACRTKLQLARRGRFSMSREELTQATDQVMAAAGRARGEVAPRPDEGSVASLARAAGETVRAWLERLEVAAAQYADGSGYRGAGPAAADLWNVLADHDASVDLRCAAARLLMRVAGPDERPRIDAIAGSVRDSKTRVLLRVAVEPVLDSAAQELEELEEQDLLAREER